MPEDHLLLDASVLVELVVDGRHRPDADRLLDRIAEDPDLVLITAAHGLVEAASALRRLVRQGALAAEDGALDLPLLTVDERLLRACGDAGIPARHFRGALAA